MINKIITLIVNIHPFPIKVKHRPKQNLSNMFLFDLFIYRGAFWGNCSYERNGITRMMLIK